MGDLLDPEILELGCDQNSIENGWLRVARCEEGDSTSLKWCQGVGCSGDRGSLADHNGPVVAQE